MKKELMKKLFSIVLVLAMVLSSCAFAEPEEGERPVYEDPVGAFNEITEPVEADLEIRDEPWAVDSYSGTGGEEGAEVDSASVSIKGDVSLETAGNAEGVIAQAEDGGYAEALVEGELDVSAVPDPDSEEVLPSASASGIISEGYGEGSEAYVSVEGNVAVRSDDPEEVNPDALFNSTGISARSTEGGAAEVDVAGNVDVYSQEIAIGIRTENDNPAGFSEGASTIDVTVDGDLTVIAPEMATGVFAQPNPVPEDAVLDWSVEVTGDVNAKGELLGTGLYVSDQGYEGSVDVNVGGGVTVESSGEAPEASDIPTMATGVYVEAENAENKVHVGNGIYVEGYEDAAGARLIGKGEENIASVSVEDGGITSVSESGDACGISENAQNESTVSADVSGDISVSGGSWAAGARLNSAEDSSALLTVSDGGIVVSSENGTAVGISADAADGGTVTADIQGDLTAQGADSAFGAEATADYEGTVVLSVEDGVYAAAPGGETAQGIRTDAGESGMIDVTVSGGITAEGEYAFGAELNTRGEDAVAVLNVTDGGITAIGTENGSALNIVNNGGTVEANITGDITASGEVYANGINISSDTGHWVPVGDEIERDFVTGDDDRSVMDMYWAEDGNGYNIYENENGQTYVRMWSDEAEDMIIVPVDFEVAELLPANTRVTVNGNIKADGDAVRAETNADSTTVIDITGNVEGQVSEGAVVSRNFGGTADISVTGDIASHDSNSALLTDNQEGETTVYVSGDISSEASEAALNVNNNGGETMVSVTGNIENSDGPSAVVIRNEAGDSSVLVEGDISGERLEAVVDSQNGGGNTTLSVEGNIEGTDSAFALRSENHGGEVSVGVAGDISLENGEFYSPSAAVDIAAFGKNSETTFTLDGSIIAETEEDSTEALVLFTANEASVTASVDGELIAAIVNPADSEYDIWAVGAQFMNGGGDMDVTIEANVSAVGNEYGYGTGLHIMALEADREYFLDPDAEPVENPEDIRQNGYLDWDPVSEKEIFVADPPVWIDGKEYSLYSDSYGFEYYFIDGKYYPAAYMPLFDEGHTGLTVIGDVYGSTNGLDLNLSEEQTATVIVDGTISSDSAPIKLTNAAETVIGGNVDLTVWEVKENEDGDLVVYNEYDEEGNYFYTRDEEAEKAIHYIVKYVEGLLNYDSVGTENGSKVTAGENTYHTALEDETVSLKFTLGENEELDGIYYNADREDTLVSKADLKQDDAGNYILKMLRGGAMLLGLKTHTHEFTELVEVTKAPTCTEDGTAVYKCSHCAATVVKPVAATGHTPGEKVIENVVEPQIGVAGSYDEVVYCTVCGAEVSRTTVTVDPLKAPVTLLLKIRDLTDKTEIAFFSDGSYKATYEDGSFERGAFRMKGGNIVLVNHKDAAKTEMAITENSAKNLYELQFASSDGKSFDFEVEGADVQVLVRSLK